MTNNSKITVSHSTFPEVKMRMNSTMPAEEQKLNTEIFQSAEITAVIDRFTGRSLRSATAAENTN